MTGERRLMVCVPDECCRLYTCVRGCIARAKRLSCLRVVSPASSKLVASSLRALLARCPSAAMLEPCVLRMHLRTNLHAHATSLTHFPTPSPTPTRHTTHRTHHMKRSQRVLLVSRLFSSLDSRDLCHGPGMTLMAPGEASASAARHWVLVKVCAGEIHWVLAKVRLVMSLPAMNPAWP